MARVNRKYVAELRLAATGNSDVASVVCTPSDAEPFASGQEAIVARRLAHGGAEQPVACGLQMINGADCSQKRWPCFGCRAGASTV